MELRDLVKRGYPLALDDYPIFDENYRSVLNNKIISHFYFREIGQETPDRFNHYLRMKMHEIMPYYNQLYKTTLIEFDPLVSEYFEKRNKSTKSKLENEVNNRFGESGSIGSERYGEQSNTKNEEIGNKTNRTNNTSNVEGNEKRTDNLEENTKVDKTTTLNTKDITNGSVTRQDDLHENKSSNSKRTDDLSEDNTTIGDSNTTYTGSKLTQFSDVPQTPIETTRVVNPSTGVITETSIDYATTVTKETDTSNTNVHQTGESHKKNTGSQSTEVKESKDNTGNQTTTDDTTISHTGTIEEGTIGNKTNTGTVDKTNHSETVVNGEELTDNSVNFTGKTTYDKELETQRNVSEKSVSNNMNSAQEENSLTSYVAGRSGISPSDLIKKYRNIIINVDMRIINELQTLFMEIY